MNFYYDFNNLVGISQDPHDAAGELVALQPNYNDISISIIEPISVHKTYHESIRIPDTYSGPIRVPTKTALLTAQSPTSSPNKVTGPPKATILDANAEIFKNEEKKQLEQSMKTAATILSS